MALRPGRRSLCLAVAGAVAAAVMPRAGWAAPTDTDLALQVKATYLYKLAPFVTWPDRAFTTSHTPFSICVVGNDPVADLVDRAVTGLAVGGRPFSVRHRTPAEQASQCHILYIGTGDPASVAAYLERVRGQPVLTVTDSAVSGDEKGVIHFVIHQDRVRFEINERLARQNGLDISSRVLNLALRVTRATLPEPEAIPV